MHKPTTNQNQVLELRQQLYPVNNEKRPQPQESISSPPAHKDWLNLAPIKNKLRHLVLPQTKCSHRTSLHIRHATRFRRRETPSPQYGAKQKIDFNLGCRRAFVFIARIVNLLFYVLSFLFFFVQYRRVLQKREHKANKPCSDTHTHKNA